MPLYLKDKIVSGVSLGVPGADGKSAYEAAKEAGYVGTETAFNEALMDMPNHITNTENPHGVTAEQVGARPDTWMPSASDVGAYTKTETDEFLQNKADLGADGKVLASQLPSIEADAYTKIQTLSDTTKTLFGLDATAVPNDAFAQINNLIATLNSSVSNLTSNVNSRARISTGSYVGNRNSGSSYPNSLTFNFKPHFLVIAISAEAGYNAQAMFFLDMLGSAYMQLSYWYCAGDSKLSNLNSYAKLVNNTVYWYSSGGLDAQMNNEYTYNYFAIG